ncbi:MAG: Molybdenum-pterin-binding protein MopB [Candidatus Ordinivivax streblomastigis]|uniref:Molybdenum-pterin-binding protein MopB n=1 Tax=Candidatus Ordinivivax streblomastigis TaxID=2540710 RepID=A0A5M8P016_9BACT|nr:MAG: Molybdenum-pterin-binding protein MopB [Candidatus Ordinivivax streblomastigis]
MYHPYKIVSKLEIDKNGGCFLNPRRVELLQVIHERGSILAASKELRMSYQQAWTIIKELNATASLPVVSRQRGGAHGGGAMLTNFGIKMVERYVAIQRRYALMLLDLDDDLQQLCAF